MYPNWQQMGTGIPAQQMQFYGAQNAYQQQMYQWYYQQQNQVPNQAGVQPAQPPVPTSMPPLPEAAPPPPSEEKPPLPPEPPPVPPAEEEKQELKPVTSEEQKKLTDLQQQAAQWQQTQQWPPQWPQQQTQQWPISEYQQYQQPPPAGPPGGELNVQFEAIQKEEVEFEQQYSQWKQQYDDWKKQNQNHPNKDQFKQYELQWQQYEQQMEDKKQDIQQRKQVIQSQMAMPQPAPAQGMPGVMPNQPGIPPQTGLPPGLQGMPSGQQVMHPGQHGMPTGQQGMQPGQGMPPGQPGMPPGQQVMPAGQQTMQTSQQAIQPDQQSMQPGQQGMPPGQQGIPPHHQGMPPNSQGMPVSSHGIMPHNQGMPPSSQGMPVSSQGIMPQNQGMPPGNQGIMNQGQMRMGGPAGLQQNNQRMGMRQNNPQRMEGPGNFNNQNQRMRFPQNENIQLQNPQQVRMGGPRGQIRIPGNDSDQKGGINQNQPGFGGPRQRFPGGPRFIQQNQMNRMQGPRGPMGRGQRPLLGSHNQFKPPGLYGQGDEFEGGEEDMCIEDADENPDLVPQENPFRRPEIQQLMEGENDMDESAEEDMALGGQIQLQGMHNMNMRGNLNKQIRGPSPSMQMRGNFQNPCGMRGPRGQMIDKRENQMKQFGNTPPRMPQKGPISLMDIRFDKPPPVLSQKDDQDEKTQLETKDATQQPPDKVAKEQGKTDQKTGEKTPAEGTVQKEFALGQSEKTATSGLGADKGVIPGFGDVSDKKEDDKDKKESSQLEDKEGENEQKDKSEEKTEDSVEDNQNKQAQSSNLPMNQGPRPQGPGQNRGQLGKQRFGFNQGQGPRQFGPNQGQGPRQFTPNQVPGHRQFTPNQGQGPRQFTPNQNQGPRQFTPIQNQGPRQFTPNQGQGPRNLGPNKQQTGEFGQNQFSGQMQGQGQRQFGPRGFGQRGQRGQGPRQFGPRGFAQNQAPRGFNGHGPRHAGPNQALMQQFEEENVEQYDEQNFGQSDEPLDFNNRFNANRPDRGMRGRGRGQMNRGRGRGRGWVDNQFQEEQNLQQNEPEEPVYSEEEEKERMRREMEEEGEQWMAAWQPEDENFDSRRDPWADRRTPPLPHDDRYGRLPYDDPYRRDPYFDREDPYLDRRDPYYPDRRPYDYDPYSRPRDYWYGDRYEPPPREPSPRLFIAPEVIDHGHKSTGLVDFTQDRDPVEYQPPQVIDYGHGKSSDDPPPKSDNRAPDYRSDSIQGYSRESYDYSRSSSRDHGRDIKADYSSSSSSSRDREKDRSSSKTVHEPKVETVNIDDLLSPPGRKHRPPQIVVILRGLPGSGKTYVGKLIKDKEVHHGGGAPRMLCLDDYFMVEVEKTEKDPETGKKVKKKVLDYEYEPEMESSYRKNMYKSFKKTIDDGFFPFIIVDAVNEKERHFEEFWSYAKSKGFQVYIAEIQADAATCSKRNTHNRSLKDIEKIEKGWQDTPKHYLRLDVRSILQEVSIQEVEMEMEEEEVKPTTPAVDKRKKEEDDEDEDVKFGEYKKSKWEIEASETQLDKLDGLIHHNKKIAPVHQSIEEFLQLPDDYDSRPLAPGQKRVRWADIEERKVQSRRRDIGFVVGQTQRDWERITDDSYADRQLNRTKYF